MRADKRRALAGAGEALVSLGVYLGTAELLAAAVGPGSAPSIAIGEEVIAHTPQSLKEFAITHFGEHDKDALLAGMYVSFVVVAALVGALAANGRRWWAVGALGLLAIVSALCAAVQTSASAIATLPSLGAGAVALAAQSVMAGPLAVRPIRTSGRPRREQELTLPPLSRREQGPTLPPLSRRRFFLAGGSLLAGAGAAYVGGRALMSTLYNAASSRAAVRLPSPMSKVRPAPGTDFAVAGLSPYVTPNTDFYRVDTALVVPQLRTETYTLNLHGMVDRPAIYSFEEILAMPMVEQAITMVCVSNPVGGPYLGNARWLGVPLAELLRRAGVSADADQLFMTSQDGMTIGADLRALMDGRPALLAVGMNGEPLPFEHGFPVRAVVAGIYGYASACKWLVDLEVTTYAAKKAYWPQRGYAEKAPVKLESKIDTPGSFAQVRGGPVVVAGSAWHPGVGIRQVQVRVDGGPWHEAELANAESADTWRLWRWTWAAAPGTHTLQVRAVDKRGQVQTATSAPVVPNGTSGRESVVVSVS